MIQLKNITKTFNPKTPGEKTVIQGLDLHVEPGEFLTIIGSNGAGKTTLFNLISGAVLPSSGSICIKEKDVTFDPEYKRAAHMGRIFQDLAGLVHQALAAAADEVYVMNAGLPLRLK